MDRAGCRARHTCLGWAFGAATTLFVLSCVHAAAGSGSFHYRLGWLPRQRSDVIASSAAMQHQEQQQLYDGQKQQRGNHAEGGEQPDSAKDNADRHAAEGPGRFLLDSKRAAGAASTPPPIGLSLLLRLRPQRVLREPADKEEDDNKDESIDRDSGAAAELERKDAGASTAARDNRGAAERKKDINGNISIDAGSREEVSRQGEPAHNTQLDKSIRAASEGSTIDDSTYPESPSNSSPLDNTSEEDVVTDVGQVSDAVTSESTRCRGWLASIGFASNLAVIIVQSPGEPPLHAKIPATMCTFNSPGGIEYDGPVTFGIRGSSSSREGLKRSYALSTVRADGGKVNAPLLGLPAENDWALYGPENDGTLGMRNMVAYDIGRAMGRYAARTQLLELFLVQDGQPLSYAQHYFGVYVLEEKPKRGKQRIDVPTMQPDQDLSGGYVIGYENDNIRPGDATFNSPVSGLKLVMHYPNMQNESAGQQAALGWIARYVGNVEASLQPGAEHGWRDFLEPSAAVDYLLGTEITKNPDGYRGSVYMNKDRGQPLRMGPMWDYNEAFGLCCGYPIEGFSSQGRSNGTSGGSAISPEGWRFSICGEPRRCVQDPVDGISSWFRATWQERKFRAAAARRWANLRSSALSDEFLSQRIQDLQLALAGGAAMRNYARWAEALRQPGYFQDDMTQWTYEIDTLRKWLLKRAEWMDWALRNAEDHPIPIGADAERQTTAGELADVPTVLEVATGLSQPVTRSTASDFRGLFGLWG